jgi:hypothetical protein
LLEGEAYVNDGASSIAGKYGSKTGYATAAAAQTPVLAQLSTNEFGNYDSRDVYTTTPTETITGQNSGAPVTVNGTVKTASTATYADSPVENSKVTVSGAGLEFYVTGQGTLYGDGSLSFYADKDGQFTFLVASHLAGKQTVTVTSGAGTSKIYLYFAAAAVTAASKVDVKVADGAAQFQSGRALDVTFTVTDKYGNPITTPSTGTDAGVLTIGQTGAGYLANTGVVVTSATGVYSTKLITNAGDLGTSTITATVDLATDVVATNSSEFGITDVTDISSAGKAIYVNTEFAKGKVVTVYIDGKRMPVKAAEATDNAVERKYTQKKAGKHTVTVRVSGGVVASETVVTTK